jgi:hypothetical protein
MLTTWFARRVASIDGGECPPYAAEQNATFCANGEKQSFAQPIYVVYETLLRAGRLKRAA